MLTQFNSFIENHLLVASGQSTLLAVSGGIDSMVMAELFHRAGFRFGIAHANFQLRGEESDGDERFVRDIAGKYAVRYFTEKFSTKEYAEQHRISIQMAARELRYRWFEEVRYADGFDLIATAHHLDDQVETFFINLLRGTGIAGLHGIPVKNGKIIRPLLFATREEISEFAAKHELSCREDRTNRETRYIRNRIRNKLMPVLRSIQPDYIRQITGTIGRIQDTESVLISCIDDLRLRLIRAEGERLIIQIRELRPLDPLAAWLYELLSPFGFNPSTIGDLTRALDQDSGRTFHSSSHRIVKDRDRLIIMPAPKDEPPRTGEEFLIGDTISEITFPIVLTFRTVSRKRGHQISADRYCATLDREKLTFPLALRKWNAGDSFQPLGMTRKKKLSDFFIDEKISIPEKEECWLLCSGDRIVWVIGYRIDHRFRVSSRSRELLVVEFVQ